MDEKALALRLAKSEALRLADELQAISKNPWAKPWERFLEVAAELRRLHAVNAELLEALKDAAEYLHDKSGCSWLRSDFQRGCRCSEDCSSIAVWKQARAAIAKAEGEKT
jgi:hypothetical protein